MKLCCLFEMKQQLLKLWRDEDGATAIEYALIAGLIAVVLIAALGALGGSISDMFGEIGKELDKVEAGE